MPDAASVLMGPADNALTRIFFSPRSDTVPVIDKVAYDTTSLTDAVKIITLDTRNEVRNWVCNHLKFATITTPANWTSNPSAALTFDWPYNDLYFTRGCPEGDSVNLVPC